MSGAQTAPALVLYGELVNAYTEDVRTKRATGEQFGGQRRVQLDVWFDLDNGSRKRTDITLTVEDLAPYRPLVGQLVGIPVRPYVNGRAVGYAVSSGARPFAAGGGASGAPAPAPATA